MAELATTESKSGIVFDDPVSSLDHMLRKAVAKRLVAEAERLQDDWRKTVKSIAGFP
jgi:hypothetical protein